MKKFLDLTDRFRWSESYEIAQYLIFEHLTPVFKTNLSSNLDLRFPLFDKTDVELWVPKFVLIKKSNGVVFILLTFSFKRKA